MKRKSVPLFFMFILFLSHISCSASYEIRPPVYWNYSNPLTIWMDQDIPYQGARVTLLSGKDEYPANFKIIEKKNGKTLIQLILKDASFVSEKKIYFIRSYRKPNDSSPAVQAVVLDSETPYLKIIENSKTIMKGGCGVVIFEASDRNLDSIVLMDDDKHAFNVQKFQQENVYIALVHWYLTKKDFSLSLRVKDRAGNVSEKKIQFKKKLFDYPVSHIQIKKTDFFKEKKDELAKDAKDIPKNETDQYSYFLKKMGEKYQFSIGSVTSKPVIEDVDAFQFDVFKPIDSPQVSSQFGVHRFFYNGKKQVRDSYHWGIDLFRSPKMDIYAACDGLVLFAGYNGGNGNMILIHHGLAIYTIYCHCSELLVKAGQKVSSGDLIAKSGTTGYSFGDHLHFGVLNQSRFVNPNEWMSSRWLTQNILQPVRLAEKYLSEQKKEKVMLADQESKRRKIP